MRRRLLLTVLLMASARILWPQEEPPRMDEAISVDFKEAHLANVLRLLSDQYGVNIVAGADVRGIVTVRLTGVTLEGALKAILSANGYGYVKEENIYRVAPLEQLAQEEEARKQLAQYEPLITQVVQLRYLDGQDAKKALQALISSRGKITVLERKTVPGWQVAGGAGGMTAQALSQSQTYGAGVGLTAPSSLITQRRKDQPEYERSRTLLITDTASRIKEILAVLKRLDKMPKQVMIDAMVVELAYDDQDALGIKWQSLQALSVALSPSGNFERAFTRTRSSLDSAVSAQTNTDVSARNTTTNHLSKKTTSDATSRTQQSLGATEQVRASANEKLNTFSDVRTAVLSSDDLRIVLSALAAKGDVDVISNPNILTLDNHEATILVGENFPIFSTSVSDQGTVTESFQYYQPVGISLRVIPQVSANQNINMLIHPTVSEIGEFVTGTTGLEYPRISIREADTQVLIRQGETVVIGGLVTGRDEETITRVPLLGDIPLIGLAFRHKNVSKKKVNLMVFVTPRLVRPDEITEQENRIFSNYARYKNVNLEDKKKKPRKFFRP